MLYNQSAPPEEMENADRVARLENFHRRKYSPVLWILFIGLICFVFWASYFRIDEVARASGEVIASSRVQVIQSVDGGVLAELNVREGDKVESGQVLARLDQGRIGAAVKEIEVRLSALKAKAIRFRAEVTNAKELVFPEEMLAFTEIISVEKALFQQRRTGFSEELRTLRTAALLAAEERELIKELVASGDVNRSEIIRANKALNDAEAKLINRENAFLEEARIELTRIEDEVAQNEQILLQRKQQMDASIFIAQVRGIVKNVRITTVGGVLGAGEELLQIIPLDDDLIVEAKIRPADIARVHSGLGATIRFDPFDYTIFGGVKGSVVYVSADTLKESTSQGEEIYYRVHIASDSNPVVSSTGKTLDILPGMTAQVDIRTGDRSLMDFLLKPLRKTLSESMGER